MVYGAPRLAARCRALARALEAADELQRLERWQPRRVAPLTEDERDAVHRRLGKLVDARLASRPKPRPVRSGDRRRRSYVSALVRGEYTAVAHAEPGIRNVVLSRASFRYGQALGADLLDEEHSRAALLEAAEHCGLPSREAQATIAAGLRRGRAHPLEI